MRNMMRVMLACAYAGTLVFAAAAYVALGLLNFVCWDSCPSESDLATALAMRLADGTSICLPGALTFAIAWVLCLVGLARTRRWAWLVAVALAVPAGVGLAVLVALRLGEGHLFPTTWKLFASWRFESWKVLPPLLLGPLVTIVAGHVLRAQQRNGGVVAEA